jgi:hypothetical protein
MTQSAIRRRRPDMTDYNFVLVLGPPPKKIRQRHLKDCPYKETHAGETGVVFFPDLETARAYQQARNLFHYTVAALPDPETAVMASVKLWGCNVAHCVHQVGKTFRRDVTEFAPCSED